MAPSEASWMPAMARSSVDLPAPLVPSRATHSPSSTVKSTSNSVCTPSYATPTLSQTSSWALPLALAISHFCPAAELARALRRSTSKNGPIVVTTMAASTEETPPTMNTTP